MTIDTADTRTAKALVALKNAGQWLKVRGADGQALAYGIESASRPGLYHFANSSQCTCEDAQHGHLCWHSRAVAMHVAVVRCQQLTRRRLRVVSARQLDPEVFRRFED